MPAHCIQPIVLVNDWCTLAHVRVHLNGRPGRPCIAFSAQCEYICALYLHRRPGRPCIAFSVHSVYITENLKHMCAHFASWAK
jgi:hypothetical protein